MLYTDMLNNCYSGVELRLIFHATGNAVPCLVHPGDDNLVDILWLQALAFISEDGLICAEGP